MDELEKILEEMAQNRIRLEIWLASPAARLTPAPTPARFIRRPNGRIERISSQSHAEWLRQFGQ